MNNIPKFIKQYSKEFSADERKETTLGIKKKRKEYFDKKNELANLLQKGKESEKSLAQKVEDIRKLEKEIDDISTSMLEKISHYFKIKNSKAKLEPHKKDLEELTTSHKEIASEISTVSEQFKKLDVSYAKDTEEKINDFYKKQEDLWINSDFSEEDMQKYFTEEHLASLSLNDYILLLKRFPKYMVTHVTRQWIRDHTGHMYHNGGLNAYSDSFINMLKDGRLRSPLWVYLSEWMKEEKIAEFLKLEDFDTKTEALAAVDSLCDYSDTSGSYADKFAIHFATEEVADTYYGSETWNEMFIVYPSVLIAARHHFHGQLFEADGWYRNDQRVWANEERWLDLNAGIVFIPADAQVDSMTGSKYLIDNNKKVVLAKDWKTFLHAKNTISSKSFRENYFLQHPKAKPTKIVYYEGDDPTKALKDWQIKNWITKNISLEKKRETHDGITQREYINAKKLAPFINITNTDSIKELKNDPVANFWRDRFRSIAVKVIDDYFDNKIMVTQKNKKQNKNNIAA